MAIFQFSRSRDSKYSVDTQATFYTCHTTKTRYKANNFSIKWFTEISISEIYMHFGFFGHKNDLILNFNRK